MKFKLDISKDWFYYIENNNNDEIEHLERLGFIGYIEKCEKDPIYVFNSYRPTIELKTLDDVINFKDIIKQSITIKYEKKKDLFPTLEIQYDFSSE